MRTHLEPVQHDFRVMGCASHVVVVSEPSLGSSTGELVTMAERRLRELESHWSRFLPDSDITRANQAAGVAVDVHADTIAVVTRALEAWRQTRGRFDITVLPALVHHGYAHSAADNVVAPPVPGLRIGDCGGVLVDPVASTLTIPPGAAIDLGGIGKGFAADLVAEQLVEHGALGALVNVGGDIAVRGRPADGADWDINLQNPLDPELHVAHVALQRGGVATSGRTVRRWTTATGESAHHLIDPTTAVPATTSLLSASVIAGDTATAEAFATAAMLADAHGAVDLLDAVGLAGLMVAADGRVFRSASFARFER